MKTHSTTQSTLKAMSLQAALALCAGTALFIMPSSAFAQINPDVKADTAEKANRIAPTDKGAHNPPDDKCGQNPPAALIARTGDTRMLLPAVRLAVATKPLNAPQTDTTACHKAK